MAIDPALLSDQSKSGLAQLAQLDPQAYEDQLFNTAQTDIQRQAGSRAQQINEDAFGRGLGLSTVNAYAQAQNLRAQSDAIAKARTDSATAARAASLAALAQAAQTAQAEQARVQQAGQFQAGQAQQQRALRQQANQANNQLLGGGLTALTGAGLYGAMRGMKPGDIGAGIKGLTGLFRGEPAAGNMGGPGGIYSGPNFATAPDATLTPESAGATITPDVTSNVDLSGGASFAPSSGLDAMSNFGLGDLTSQASPWDFSALFDPGAQLGNNALDALAGWF